jgi:hypothetical protein
MFARLRAYIGFLPVRRTFPNSTHYALAALQQAGIVGPIITQNVDGLHHAALRRVFSEAEVNRRILELHGSIFVSPVFPLLLPLVQQQIYRFLLYTLGLGVGDVLIRRIESTLSTWARLSACGVPRVAWSSQPKVARISARARAYRGPAQDKS